MISKQDTKQDTDDAITYPLTDHLILSHWYSSSYPIFFLHSQFCVYMWFLIYLFDVHGFHLLCIKVDIVGEEIVVCAIGLLLLVCE